MQTNINNDLLAFMKEHNISNEKVQLPCISLATEKIKVIMINEVPPENPDDYFYSKTDIPDYMKTTLSLFQNAAVDVNSIEDILDLGIYITTAVKTPKSQYTVDTAKIVEHLPILEHEISLFPGLKVIMLMGDVAKKAFNMIAKKNTKKNAIPSGSTYRIRDNEIFYQNIRIFPSYIMTGGNILIEKSKCHMISDDIRRMRKYIEECDKSCPI